MENNLRELKGLGAKTEQLFHKLGLYSVRDLLYFYPAAYEEYEEPGQVCQVMEGKQCVIRARLGSGVSLTSGKTKAVVSTVLQDSSGRLDAVWFNMGYLRSRLRPGREYIFRGRASRKNGRLVIEQAQVYDPAEYEPLKGKLLPVYHLTKGLSNKTVRRMVTQALDSAFFPDDPLPEDTRLRLGLVSLRTALCQLHFPSDADSRQKARQRLVFDEFFSFILAVRICRRMGEEAENHFPLKLSWTTERIINRLPFSLTKAQQNVWHDIERNLCGSRLMARLVQGDVGSGKTILAFLAMALTAENGYQAALMAPTQVLARQHFEAFTTFVQSQGLTFLHPVLLTGSMKQKEKNEALRAIAEGEANCIIGTHALIRKEISFKALALAITDEQHRFGVRQRQALSSSQAFPHVLVMSATPIPRTLGLILYGDLDISVVDEMPADRIPIKNCLVGTAWRPNAYRFIQKQLEEGHQAYVICPLVEESEGLEAENVMDYSEKLREFFPENIHIRPLHGRMKDEEKNEVMQSFSQGQTDILVSTTVVEVGVNVPNATVMLIENAERFGLAQLHQLRGRVGRGKYQSYCIFIQGKEDEETSARLKLLAGSNDGFYLAGEDLRLRGPGDFFGLRQSGELLFSLADIYQDSDILSLAGREADFILKEDPLLTAPGHTAFRQLVDHQLEGQLERMEL